MLRLIKEEELLPSRATGSVAVAYAAQRWRASGKLEPGEADQVGKRGELDWIVMKALEKERARRYETANGFARDIQRYLADESVEACPPSASYRLRKFARKHRTALTTVQRRPSRLLLVAGVAVSTWQAIRATLLKAMPGSRRMKPPRTVIKR